LFYSQRQIITLLQGI